MIRVEVTQGENKVQNVYVDLNQYGIYSILINYEQRWCEYFSGSGSDGNDERYDSYYLCSSNENRTDEDYSEIKVFHDGELDDLYLKVTQEKDQLHILYMPYRLIEDGQMVTSWESDEWREFLNTETLWLDDEEDKVNHDFAEELFKL